MRLLASRHADDVCGLVLIEPAIAEEWVNPTAEQQALIARGTRLCRYGTAAARLGVAKLVARAVRLGALNVARALVSVVSRGGLARQDEAILAPIWKLPPPTRALLEHMWTQPKFFEALGSQIGTISESAAQVLAEPRTHYGDVPLIVISSEAASEQRLVADRALANQSRRGRHVLAAGSGHWVPLDAPQVVIDAVLSVLRSHLH
jgi:pimeloyl-ACP methyl ester carboxylesterase